MNKQELLKEIATSADVSQKDADAVLKALVSVITENLAAGTELSIPDLGKFGVTARAERTGRNPLTGTPLTIAAKKSPKFTAAKALKDATNR